MLCVFYLLMYTILHAVFYLCDILQNIYLSTIHETEY